MPLSLLLLFPLYLLFSSPCPHSLNLSYSYPQSKSLQKKYFTHIILISVIPWTKYIILFTVLFLCLLLPVRVKVVSFVSRVMSHACCSLCIVCCVFIFVNCGNNNEFMTSMLGARYLEKFVHTAAVLWPLWWK